MLAKSGAKLVLTALLVATPRAAAAAAAGEVVWTFQGIEDVLCADEIEDQNGDGVPDVIVETYDAGAVGDHLWCLSGAAPGPAAEAIWSVKPVGGPSSSGGYGDKCVTTAPDLNGDGVQDVLLGTAWGGRTAYAIDGTDGAVIWNFDTYVDRPPVPAVSGWVYSMIHVPDVDGDAVPDVFFVCGSENDRVYHASGADGTILYDLEMTDAVFCAAGLDDVSGDGLADAVFGVGDFGDAIWCLRGLGPPLVSLWNHTMPGTVYDVARIADVSGDGVNDVLAGIWASVVYCFDGATGDTVWTAPLPGGAFVMRIAILDDVNGDGFQDAAIASWDNSAHVISGADGTPIWSRPTGGDVWAIERIDDVTGDGINDVVAGSFDHLVYLLDGVTGVPKWTFDTGNRLYFVTGVSDMTGNGVADVFAGSQKLTSSPGGHGFLIEGGEPGPTPVPLPMYVEGFAGPRGVELTLRNAERFAHAHVERSEGAGAAAAAARFRAEVAQAYRDGELTAREAVQARAQDPEVAWTRLTSEAIGVRGGQAHYVDGTAGSDRTYRYRFAFVSGDQIVGYSPTFTAQVGSDAGVPEMRVFPNPIGSSGLAIEFQLRHAQRVRIQAFDTAGRKVAEVHDGDAAPGPASVSWSGRDASGRALANGVYFLRLEGDGFVSSKKVTILR